MWKLVSVRLEIVLVPVQDRCIVCTKRTIGSENCFEHTRWYSKMTRLKWKLVLVHLEIVLILMQDSCTVFVLDVADGTPR
jgi:hypothetical protein